MQLIKGGISFRAKKELGFMHEIWQPSFYDRRVRRGAAAAKADGFYDSLNRSGKPLRHPKARALGLLFTVHLSG